MCTGRLTENLNKIREINGNRSDGMVDFYRINRYLQEYKIIEVGRGLGDNNTDGEVHIKYMHSTSKKKYDLIGNCYDIDSFVPLVYFVEVCRKISIIKDLMDKICGVGVYEDYPEDHLSLVELDLLLEKIYDYSMELWRRLAYYCTDKQS